MMRLTFPFRTILFFIALWMASPRFASGYVKEGPVWPSDAVATMQLQLGPTNVTLEDGLATWDDSAADALDLWNPHMDIFQFAWTKEAITSQASGDGINSVFFSTSVFGDDFGEDVLGVTVLLYSFGDGEVTQEADVLINQAYQFDSYRGPLKPGDPGSRVYDVHRIFLHEFGHVLGLDHPDDYGQNVVSIMNSVISDLDSLATDDIDGAVSLYSLRITSPGELDATINQAVSFQVTANGHVSSYGATGLPPGLTINSTTGLISGKVSVTGGFDAQVTIHGVRDVTVPLFVYVTSTSAVGDLRQLWAFTVNRLITDPVRNRIYASLKGSNNVALIDAVTLAIIKTFPVASEPSGLAISADGNTLFVAERGATNPEIGVIDLDALQAKSSLPAPFPGFDVAVGMDNRLFVTSWGDFPADIAQVDSTTGDLLAPFPRGLPYGLLQVSPDRKTLYLCGAAGTPSTIYALDVSSDIPVTLQQSPFNRVGSPYQTDFALSHDGTMLCAPGSDGVTDFLRIPSADLTATDGGYSFTNGGYAGGALAFSPDDQTMMISEVAGDKTGIDIFDATTQVYQRTIFTNDYFAPTAITTDALGKYLFAGSFEVGELRVYALGSAGLPAHKPKSESLLNVSTRLNTQDGEQTLIGGFIVTGDTPKNLLIRGLGPSLPVPNPLAIPELTLYDAAGEVIGSNVFWRNEYPTPVILTGLAPTDDSESALYVTLFPGAYTVTLLGPGFVTGVGLLEVYDISADSESVVANLSTRGQVGTGDDVMIGGLILSEDQPTKVLVRAIGPSLTKAGISDPLQDPVLELHGPNGDLILSNDNWRDTQEADIEATGIAPSYDKESAIVATLSPGAYTAIVRGKNDTTGIALVEIYNVALPSSTQ
jgi:YVTN family beta-propeller protein